ncbi:MAG: alkaline phosphatase D family protein [Deltaproteobacteria bacterium]|nr:alkaline phosphatase D family protein [Deltaproteobacteria bacterium]
MAIDRREFLRTGAAGAALAGLSVASLSVAGGCATPSLPHPGAAPRAEGQSPFLHGVASGDPLADRVILWTRVSPEAYRMASAVRVGWWIANDAEAKDVVARGEIDALPERDFTVQVDAAGLAPGHAYHYGFVCEGVASPVGRTRTLPEANVGEVRLALASCANLPQGYFNAYACIAARDDLDAVVHLGDYLYEYGNGEYGDGTALGRIPDPVHEILSLEDYRRRHAQYKADPDLQAAHARHPWLTVWDDHESANDAWKDGAQNHTEGDAPGGPDGKGRGEGAWTARKLAAIRAYHEWMPIRDLPDGLFRSFRIGELVDLVMLDTRLHGRDAKVGPKDHAGAADPERSLLGADQTAWLLEALSASKRAGTQWRVIGQQVVFAPLRGVFGDFNADSWDGYRANRAAILDHLEHEAIDDVVILTGDVHSAWALDVPAEAPVAPVPPNADTGAAASAGSAQAPKPGTSSYDPKTGRGSRAVEVVAPAVSSPPFGTHPQGAVMIEKSAPMNPQIRYSNALENGWVLLGLTAERARAEFFASESVKTRSAICHRRAVLEARAATAHWVVLEGAEG